MGGYLSKQKTDPNDYEKVLSELDEKIQKMEVKLSDIKVRQRRTGVLVVTYCTLAWLLYVAYCFLLLQQYGHTSAKAMTSKTTLILAIPIGIHYLRNAIAWFYARKHTIEETRLGSLRGQQKLKVEELKKKTSYYTTQSLLDRYDAETLAQRKRQLQLYLQQQQQQQRQQQQVQEQTRNKERKPVSMPGPRTMPDAPQRILQQQQQHSILTPGNGSNSTTRLGLSSTSAAIHLSQPIPKCPPQWYDKILDTLIGEEGLETKYALICHHCFTHNGLVLPGEVDIIQYICPHCKKFNPSRKSRQLHPDGPVLPPPALPSPIGSPIPGHATVINQKKQDGLQEIVEQQKKRHVDLDTTLDEDTTARIQVNDRDTLVYQSSGAHKDK